MSLGPMTGVFTSAAGVPLAQTQGSEVDRARNEVSSYQRTQQSQRKADNAAGVGATDGENHETNERDADGRRPWEFNLSGHSATEPEDESQTQSPPGSRDTSGTSGNQVDLSA